MCRSMLTACGRFARWCGSSAWWASSWWRRRYWSDRRWDLRDGGRLSAAIEVLDDIEARHRPVKLALKGWGEAHRFAGSKDRAFVSGLVLDALRRKRSLAWMMQAETARALV